VLWGLRGRPGSPWGGAPNYADCQRRSAKNYGPPHIELRQIATPTSLSTPYEYTIRDTGIRRHNPTGTLFFALATVRLGFYAPYYKAVHLTAVKKMTLCAASVVWMLSTAQQQGRAANTAHYVSVVRHTDGSRASGTANLALTL
jgi:hypothetical protein